MDVEGVKAPVTHQVDQLLRLLHQMHFLARFQAVFIKHLHDIVAQG